MKKVKAYTAEDAEINENADENKIDLTNWPQACVDASEKFHQAAQNIDWSKFERDLMCDFSKLFR
jgi:hypothetical protein